MAWCARAVREAAADMTLLQQRQEGEELPNNTMRGWNSEAEFNCTYGECTALCVCVCARRIYIEEKDPVRLCELHTCENACVRVCPCVYVSV